MVQPIQFKRRVTGIAGFPATLLPGEPAYNSLQGQLVIGDGTGTVQILVGPSRQLEIHAGGGNQTVAAGVKTWAAGAKIAIAVADLQVSGGAAGQLLQTDGTGVLTWVTPSAGVVPATAAEIAAGTDNTKFVSPLGLRSQAGADAATLTTTAKLIVPAINELKTAVDALGLESQFAGTFDATASTIVWAPNTGTGAALPPATVANQGWYLIATVGGAAPPTGGPAGTYTAGDWILSTGTAWTALHYGGVSNVTADQVPLNPAVGTWTDVQQAIVGLDAENGAQQTDIDDRVLRAGDTMTGVLNLLNATPLAANEAAAKAYVDAQRNTRVAKIGDTMTGPLVLPEHATNKAYVDGANLAQDTITAAADLLRVLKAGDTMTGPLILPAAMPTLPAHAAHKAYVDQEILAVSGGASVLVTGPELTGTGLAGAEITFTGITAQALTFTGTGLSTDPLVLALVDGGTY